MHLFWRFRQTDHGLPHAVQLAEQSCAEGLSYWANDGEVTRIIDRAIHDFGPDDSQSRHATFCPPTTDQVGGELSIVGNDQNNVRWLHSVRSPAWIKPASRLPRSGP